MAELIGLILTFSGVPLVLVGWVWLAVYGFRATPLWGILITLCPTFAAPVLALDHWKQVRIPLLLHLAGVLGVPPAVSKLALEKTISAPGLGFSVAD